MEPAGSVEAEAAGLLAELIRIPSVNPSLGPAQPGEVGEQAIAEFARGWLAERGLRSWLEEVEPGGAASGRPNVVAETGAGEGPTLVLCAHLDTVATVGMTIPPFSPRLENGRMYGRGAYDMKGGVAAAMLAAAALQGSGLRGRLVVALVADEEHASLGAQSLVRRFAGGGERADACVVTEPTGEQLIVGHKGFVWIEITTRGRAAHGSRFDLGASAIAAMAPIVTALEQHDAHTLRGRGHAASGLLGPPSLHCARIDGGSAWSTYAESCRLEVERRTVPGEDGESVLRELRQVIAATGQAAELRLVLERAPMLCDPQASIAAALRTAIAEAAGAAPAETGVGYWTDAALFAAAGIPTLIYGPAGAGAHEAVEWVELESVVRCGRVLASAAARFCG